uniref:Secreted protein n=1 Tax=Stegastes partitus TaxID=144197 RepID=A0A3B5B2J4_9TELE
MCAFSLLSWMKLFPHTLHLNGFSPVWMRMCLFRLCCRVKPAPHVSHVNIFPLWTDWCVLSDRLFTKALPQTVHLYGCSPVWTLRWHCSVKAYLKPSPHSEHLCGFSTACTTW